LPYFYVQSRTALVAFNNAMTQSQDARRLFYVSTLTGSLDAAKETRVFGLGDYLLRAYEALASKVQHNSMRLARYQGIGGAAAGVLAMVGYFGAYVYLIGEVLAGRLTIGDLTVYGGAFVQSQFQLQYIAAGLGGIVENHLFLKDLFELLDLGRTQPPPTLPPVPLTMRSLNGRAHTSAIVFDSVRFRYPGHETDVLRGVSLAIPRGQVAALVGENGAGKTTLIKLLCGLYHPAEGRITLDGADIQSLDPSVLHAELGVLFQDFVHYHLSARENVGFGDVAHVEDLGRIREAARRAGVDSVLDRLPRGYDTQLGKVFEAGHELSGGEWQRLALARAYMRDAPILVLDEPTASLDPRAEQRIFEEVRRLLSGRTATLISHRFSTVRLADHIFVLDNGLIAEHGTHDELVAMGGRYAELYELQAASYR
jgi:ATP-binding cassette, subfamily B, bacterial